MEILGLNAMPTASGLAGLAALGESPSAGSFGFADAPSNIAGFWVSGDLLSYYIYTPWGVGAYRGNFDITGNCALSSNLLDVRADPLRTDAVLVLEEMTSNRIYYILLPRSDYLAGITGPFTTWYPYFTTDHYDRDMLGYTQNGFIAFQWGGSGTNKFVG